MSDMNIFRSANLNLSGEDIMMLSPLQLAYIGDAVYELLIRTYVLDKNLNVNDLHKRTIKYVRAESQANFLHNIEEMLTEKELGYVKKGRNTKTNSSPKNSDLIDYKYATGFECLLGYLYLTNQDERLKEVFDYILRLDI
ncbi:MAG: ribonuclease III domain-containing protein [Thermotaleaceae bacterium]|jgi:ribonuclease-3 family protein